MKYRLRDTGEIKSQGQLRRLNPNKSLPKVWKQAVLDDLNVDPILSTPKPEVTELQSVYVSGTEQNENGEWVELWTVVDRFSDVLDADGNVTVTKEEQEAEYYLKKNTELLEAKKDQIRSESLIILNAPVTDTNGIVWNGGFDSALIIDGRVRIAQNASLTEVTIFDNDNLPHTLTLEEATSVVIQISAQYEAAFVRKQTAMAALDQIDLTLPSITDLLDAVVL